MDVVAWSQNLTDERAAEVGARRVEKEELFATADVVTVHLRELRRAVLTPHLGYVTRGSYEVYYADAVEDVAAWMGGEPIRLLT